MDYIYYVPKTSAAPSTLPACTATPSAPKTLYWPQMDLFYVNTGSGWTAVAQFTSKSVYQTLSATTKTAVLTTLQGSNDLLHKRYNDVVQRGA
jgi:hypothetical protein